MQRALKSATGWIPLFLFVMFVSPSTATASSGIVISQIYGGGENSGAILRNDFVELFNRGSAAVSVTGWSLQYASATGSSWEKVDLTGTIQAGQYYLIALAAGAGGTASLPTADATGGTNLSATAGKLLLVSSSALAVGNCPLTTTALEDFVGYGSTVDCSKGMSTPTPTNTTALFRGSNGCRDTGDNAQDFTLSAPSPRNSSSTLNVCGGATPPPPTGGGTGTAPTPTIGGAPVIFAHFAQGGGYQTSFTFNNLSNKAATITLNIYSQNGTMINTTTLPISATGSVRSAMSGSMPNVGWAQASASPPVDLAGTETIQLFNSAGGLVMEASVLGAQPDTALRLPVFEKDGFGTGVALVNLGSTTSVVTLVLRKPNGEVSGATTLSLAPGQQLPRFVFELFPGLTDFEGTLEVSAPRSIAALALRLHLASGIFSTVPVSPTPTEVFFSPNAGTAARLVQQIQQALSTIDIAIYTFTRDEIADALIAAKARGVAIRILADRMEANATSSDVARLEAAGIPLKRAIGSGGGILHDKYAIVDGRLLVTGSYNWSTNAEVNNDENAVFIRDASVIAAFQTNFNAMWSSR